MQYSSYTSKPCVMVINMNTDLIIKEDRTPTNTIITGGGGGEGGGSSSSSS
jgi:hypothetical protein